MRAFLDHGSALLGRSAPVLKRFVPPAHRRRVWAAVYTAMPTAGRAAAFARWFRKQADYCRRQGSPLYGHLLEVAAADIERRGPCWTIVQVYEARRDLPPAASALAFMAAVHQVVLEQPGCALAPFYPSAGGTADLERVEPAFLDVVAAHRDRVAELLTRPVQTNEVARSRVLVGGFLLAGSRTALPLRVLEFGSSAGLNLRWDRYFYEVDGAVWGDRNAPVRLTGGYTGGRPPLHLHAEVAERQGCDLSPIDPRSGEGQLKLLSHVWADQVDRIALLRAALAAAADVDAPVEAADAAAWVERVLASPRPGLATVIFDTCMMEYLDPAVRTRIHETIAAAGTRATPEAPLAWLHLGPGAGGGPEELHLTSWPGGRRELLATCDPYGREVRWHGPRE